MNHSMLQSLSINLFSVVRMACISALLIATTMLSPGLACAAEGIAVSSAELQLNTSPFTGLHVGWGEPVANQSIIGKPLTIAGTVFKTGIGLHAAGYWAFRLDGKAQLFRCKVGIDDETGGKGSAEFSVYAEDGRRLAGSGILKGGEPAKQLVADLTGQSLVFMVFSDGGDGFQFDHLDLIEPVIRYQGDKPIPMSDAGQLPPTWLHCDHYTVQIEDRQVPVHVGVDKNLGPYAFTGFDLSQPATVKITGPCDMTKTVIHPAGVRFTAKGRELTLTLDKPQKISIEPDGYKNPLLLFANPPVVAPTPSPDLIRLGPGIHRPKDGKIILTDNQTLFLDAGAILLGTVQARDAKNVHIAGRGIIDGSSWGWQAGPARFLVHFHNCKDSGIEGVTLRESFFWTLCIVSCQNFKAENLKIMGGRFVNDDGIDICNSQKITVRDCFVRTYDDCLSIKGIPSEIVTRNGYVYNWPSAREHEPVEDVDIADCIFWGGPCRVIEIGPECQATHMRNVRIRDSKIIHYYTDSGNSFPPIMFEVGEDCLIEDFEFSNITVNLDSALKIIDIQAAGTAWQTVPGPGNVRNIRFKNLGFTGVTNQRIHLLGGDAKHVMRDIQFENLSLNGEIQKGLGPRFDIGRHVEGVTVTPAAER